MKTKYWITFSAALVCLSLFSFAQQNPSAAGIFENHADVGDTPKAGALQYAPSTGEYRVTGGGANIWGSVDAFHYAWKQVSGDMALTADVRFEGACAVEHRKAVLMVRQSLDPGSAYADVALHGDGLTALQYRPTAGAETQELRSSESGPMRIRIERRGNQFTMFAGKPGEKLVASATVAITLQDPVYAGIAVSSHDANVLETAVFSNVTIEKLAPRPQNPTNVRSKLSIYDLRDKSVRVIYTADKLWEAPNWSPDGKYLLANSGGHLYRFAVNADTPSSPQPVNLDSSYQCNNDHGPSPDGKLIAFSANHAPSNQSQVFVSNSDGSNPRLLTPKTPSYFHGWSPDERWLAFVAERGGNFDIFRVPVGGGEEQRLTSSTGFDDGPDYSPDGKWIYINSNRSGAWDIWRFPSNGAGKDDAKAERITSDELEDWFPHSSPDGKSLVFLSFPKGTPGHDAKLDIQLRMLSLDGGKVKPGSMQVLTNFFGGQGTINVNSWSPDSTRFAFVSYELLP